MKSVWRQTRAELLLDMVANSKRNLLTELLVTARLWIKIQIYFPASSFLFANRGTGEGFVEVLVTDSLQMHHIQTVDKDGSTPLVGLGQHVPVSKLYSFSYQNKSR